MWIDNMSAQTPVKVEDTSGFEDSGFHRPELDQPPDKKKLSKILKKIDKLGKLIASGHSTEITQENFSQFSQSQINEANILAQTNRLRRLVMSGNIEEITPENLPDLPEEVIEQGLFEATSHRADWFWQVSQATADEELKAALVAKANDILNNRDKRMKEYLKRSEEPAEIPIVSLTKPEKDIQAQRPRASPYL